jgi:hypothetical protein
MRVLSMIVMVSALMLPQSAMAACLQDGEAITGKLAWMSLTQPQGKPIPAPFLMLDKPACAHDALGNVQGTRVQLLLKGIDPLQNVKEGDTLTVTANYGRPETKWHIGDIVAFDAQIVSPH